MGCKYGLNENVSNLKQKWDLDECWCECKELDEWGSSKDCYMKNTSTHDSECNKTCTIYEYLDIKNCSGKRRLVGKLVLACADEILNTTKTFLHNKIAVCETKCLIHTIALVIKCLLLIAVNFISCYLYHKKHGSKKIITN